MPLYEFQCRSCGLSFNSRMSFAKAKAKGFEIPCKACGVKVRRKMSEVNYQFSHKPTSALPQNTGIHSLDTNYDRVIGRDAEEKWKEIEKRQQEKRTLLKNNPDKTGYDIRRRLDNHYEISKSEERKAYETGLGVGQQIKTKGRKL